jgi:hypothetical protein
MVVVCPIRSGAKMLSKRDLKAQFSDMVDRRFPDRSRGRPIFESAAKYRILGYPNLEHLGIYLAVYDLRKDEPKLTLWQIGERLHKEKKFRSALDKITNETDSEENKSFKRKRMGIAVSSHLKIAKEIIENAAGSVFPVRSKDSNQN